MRTQSEAEMQRAAVASEEFKDCFCSWWPAPYKALLPVTYDGALLMKAKQHIDQVMKAHYEAYRAEAESPWAMHGEWPKLVDWSGFSGTQAFGMSLGRPIGMPGWPKPGFHTHPDVVSAETDAHRTAEHVAFVAQKRSLLEWEAASLEWAEATNSGADEATLQKLKDKETAAGKAHTAAQQAFESLRKNPARGLKIVRDALTFDQQIVEQNGISRKPTSAADGGRETNQ